MEITKDVWLFKQYSIQNKVFLSYKIHMKIAKHIIAIFFVLAFASFSFSQQNNLIPNNSFEEYSGVPLGWFYNGNQFTRLVKYWNSPTLASPDVFGPGIIVPAHWQKKGFGNQHPQEGLSMVGITVYGCSEGKPHCREYIQIQLNESLVKGQKYQFSYWLAHLDGSIYTDKLGAYFSVDPIKQNNDDYLNVEPQVATKFIVKPNVQQWQKISNEYIADDSYNYITIGNFYEDKDNKIDRLECVYEFGYYYLDNMELIKVPPFIAQEVPPDDLSLQNLEIGKKIQLKNIYFDLDKSDLLPRSFVELNKLKKILEENPDMRIEVHGHTDIQGESDYNIELSLTRSQAVTKYLIDSGIDSGRIDYKGFGSNFPIADNSDELGRKLNRRVEILIIAL